MKKLILSAAIAASIMGGAMAYADVDSATNNAGAYVKDSVITTKVKAKLAAKHMSTLTNIKVDTDSAGVVWLSGKAPTKDASDLAEELTKNTKGVKDVHNKIVVGE